jgi:hypothetical protein
MLGYRHNANHAFIAILADQSRESFEDRSVSNVTVLSRPFCTVIGCGLTVRTLWLLRVLEASVIGSMCLKHDATLGRRDLGSLSMSSHASMRKATRIVGTAHEEQSVDSILLSLLTRHS